MRRFTARTIRRVLARRRPHPSSFTPWRAFIGVLWEPCYVCGGRPKYHPHGDEYWTCPVVACSDCGCNLWVEALDSEPRKGA